jgi:hypothetical protein
MTNHDDISVSSARGTVSGALTDTLSYTSSPEVMANNAPAAFQAQGATLNQFAAQENRPLVDLAILRSHQRFLPRLLTTPHTPPQQAPHPQQQQQQQQPLPPPPPPPLPPQHSLTRHRRPTPPGGRPASPLPRWRGHTCTGRPPPRVGPTQRAGVPVSHGADTRRYRWGLWPVGGPPSAMLWPIPPIAKTQGPAMARAESSGYRGSRAPRV